MGQHASGQELAKLPRDELGQAGLVGPVGSGAQEVSSKCSLMMPWSTLTSAWRS